jgi:hypothetical protein
VYARVVIHRTFMDATAEMDKPFLELAKQQLVRAVLEIIQAYLAVFQGSCTLEPF